jgi:hypothetical protein
MAFNNYRKRRAPHGPSKNELRAARHKADIARASARTLRQQFPHISHLYLEIRLEGSTGLPLGRESRQIEIDDPLILEIPCPSTCGNGQFNLLAALEESVKASNETQEGLAICQTASYMDARTACGTKLYYRFTIEFKGDSHT